MRVLRVYHSGLIPAWRRREDALRELGVDVLLVTAAAWNEGGRDVCAEPAVNTVVVRTWGRHPALFVYDPIPIARILRRERFDVLDFHEEPFSVAAGELALLRWLFQRRSPMLLYSAQNLCKRYPLPFRWLENALLRAAAAIYVCSTGAAEVLRRKGAPGPSVRVLPLGVDLDLFHPEGKWESGADVLYVGRLLPEKGVDVLLRAMATLDGAILEIVGAGPEDEALRRLATELRLEPRVRFRGFVTPGELPHLYRSTLAVVVPSLPTPSWTEQFCRVAVEAMACGIPVVTSDAGALPEVVGDAGLRFAAGDDVELAAVLGGLLADADLRSVLGRRAIERAREFAWPAVAAKHARLYTEVATR